MKYYQTKLIGLLTLLLFLSVQINGQKFLIKSGYVEYKLSGNTNGTKKIWWDNYGDKMRTEIKSVTKTNILGMSQEDKKNTIEIVDGKDIYSIDSDKNTGVKSANPFFNSTKDLTKDLSEAEKKKLGKDLIAAFGGEKIGSEKILGENCDIYSVMGTKTWISEAGVLLKSEANILGITANETAIKYDKNIKIPSDKFQPPKGIKYQDMTTTQNNLPGNLLDMIGDDDYDDDDDNIVPLKYSYEKFKKVINAFSLDGYTKTMMHNHGGQYVAMFTKGLRNVVAITLTSMQNTSEIPDKDGYEKFTADGKICYYGEILDEESTALLVEYPKDAMFLMIVEKPLTSKDQMVSYLKKLNF